MKTNLPFPSIKTIGFFIACACSFEFLLAQSNSRKMNGGNEFDYGNCVLQTLDKGICIIGSTNSFNAGSFDVYVIKLDSNYNLQWSRTYDWGKNEYGLSAVVTQNQDIVITGYCTTSEFSDYLSDAFALKINAHGKPLWCRSLGGGAEDKMSGIIENSKKELILAGNTRSFGSGLNDIYIAKLSAEGALIWTRTLGTASEDIAYSIAGAKKGFAICGMSGNFLPFVVKCDSSGNALWSKTISGSNSSIGVFHSIIQTDDNGFALTGYTTTTNDGYDVFNTKINAKGAVEWCVTLGNSGDDKGNAIMQDKNGEYIINGYTNYARNGYLQSLYLIKLNSAGSLLWNKTITEQNDAIGTSVCRSYKDAYVVTGSAWKSVDGYLYKPDIYLAKFDTLGVICGTSTVQNYLNVVVPYISNINYSVSGGGALIDNIVTTHKGNDFNVLCSGSDIQQSTGNNNNSNSSQQAFTPNPFKITLLENPVKNGWLKLKYNNINQKDFVLNLINIQGNIVFSKKIHLSAASGIEKIDMTNYAAGYYLLNLSNAEMQASIKFIKED